MKSNEEHEGLAAEIIYGLKKERGAWRAATIILAVGVVIMAAVLAMVIM